MSTMQTVVSITLDDRNGADIMFDKDLRGVVEPHGVRIVYGDTGTSRLYPWHRIMSVTLRNRYADVTLHDLETGACKCQAPSDGSTSEGNCLQCGHAAHLSRKYCGALA